MIQAAHLHAVEILDSRGRPTVAATIRLTDGSLATVSIPSGASTGKAEAKDFRNVKLAAEVAHPPVERSRVQRMPLFPQMSENLLRPSRVPSAFTVNSIKDVGHRSKQYKAGGSHNIRVAKRGDVLNLR